MITATGMYMHQLLFQLPSRLINFGLSGLFHFCRKNTLRFTLRHIVALSHLETERDYIRTSIVKQEQQYNLHPNWAIYSVELDYVETETASFRFPKFWGRPNLHIGMHASCERRSQTKERRIVQLMSHHLTMPLCDASMQKEKEK